MAKEIEKFRKRVLGRVLKDVEEKEVEEAEGRVSCREEVTTIPAYPFRADKHWGRWKANNIVQRRD